TCVGWFVGFAPRPTGKARLLRVPPGQRHEHRRPFLMCGWTMEAPPQAARSFFPGAWHVPLRGTPLRQLGVSRARHGKLQKLAPHRIATGGVRLWRVEDGENVRHGALAACRGEPRRRA